MSLSARALMILGFCAWLLLLTSVPLVPCSARIVRADLDTPGANPVLGRVNRNIIEGRTVTACGDYPMAASSAIAGTGRGEAA